MIHCNKKEKKKENEEEEENVRNYGIIKLLLMIESRKKRILPPKYLQRATQYLRLFPKALQKSQAPPKSQIYHALEMKKKN